MKIQIFRQFGSLLCIRMCSVQKNILPEATTFPTFTLKARGKKNLAITIFNYLSLEFTSTINYIKNGNVEPPLCFDQATILLPIDYSMKLDSSNYCP